MAEAPPARPRPLSPHLSIYKVLPNMAMSILHRITGVALYTGTVLLAWWLLAAATGPEAFATVSWFFDSLVGRLVLFGYTWALMHHMIGGLRHFIWDMGAGFDLKTVDLLSYGTAIGSITLTVLIWVAGYGMLG